MDGRSAGSAGVPVFVFARRLKFEHLCDSGESRAGAGTFGRFNMARQNGWNRSEIAISKGS